MTEEMFTAQALNEMKENVRRAVQSLEVCWRCQNVSECRRHVLGNLVLVWLCGGCQTDMDQFKEQQPIRSRKPRKIMA